MTTVTITGAGTTHSATYPLASSAVTAVNAGTVGTSSSNIGVLITGSNDILTNSGVVNGGTTSGTKGAVVVKTGTGDSITNQSGGVIQGHGNLVAGIYLATAGSVTNFGTIASGQGPSGNSANGIVLHAGGVVINSSTGASIGTISGGGVFAQGVATVTNSGLIIGDSVYGGVDLAAGGIVTNLSGGTISYGGAGYGIEIAGGGGTVTNAGTITAGGTNGSAVILSSGVTNEVIVDPGGVFVGSVTGGTPADATLELAAGGSTGTISNLGSFTNFGTLTFDPLAQWLVSGASTGLLSTATISGFGSGDTLAMPGTLSISHSSSSGGATKLTLSNAATLTFAGTISNFQTSTSGGVTDLTTLCFCRGTSIRTPKGEVQVEQLAVGDMVTTYDDTMRVITWIGKGEVLATRGKRSVATPVIVQKGALAGNVPSRDLRVTKGHSLYIDGVLIPVEFLINHKTIIWDDSARAVELYHIELDSHDVLFANGTPAESYRDDGNRRMFHNADEGQHLPPQEPCAPVLTGGPIVDAIWRRLLDRVGPRHPPPMTKDADVHLLVNGERVDAMESSGLVLSFRLPGRPSSVYLASREVVPAELGLARDPRSLGVALRSMAVRQGTQCEVVRADDTRLTDGFHAYEEADDMRWTDGRAALPAEVFARFVGEVEVVLALAMTTQYPDYGDSIERLVA